MRREGEIAPQYLNTCMCVRGNLQAVSEINLSSVLICQKLRGRFSSCGAAPREEFSHPDRKVIRSPTRAA
jgi:hypothetical protein